MELAARLALAFPVFAAAVAPSTDALIVPQPALATLRPPASMEKFAERMVQIDPALEPLIARRFDEYPAPEFPEDDAPPPPVEETPPVPVMPERAPGDLYSSPREAPGNARVMRAAGYAWSSSEYMWIWPHPVRRAPRPVQFHVLDRRGSLQQAFPLADELFFGNEEPPDPDDDPIFSNDPDDDPDEF